MSKAEILAGLKTLSRTELAEVQAGLDELLGDTWIEHGELSAEDRSALDTAVADYRTNPENGASWDTVVKRLRDKLPQ